VRQRDIEVIVRSRLLSEYGINRPATIDVNLQAILFQERNDVGGVLLKHDCSLAAALRPPAVIATRFNVGTCFDRAIRARPHRRDENRIHHDGMDSSRFRCGKMSRIS
jgi:hypothetical protein